MLYVRTHAEWRSFSVEIAEFAYLVRVTVGVTIGPGLNESNDLNINKKGVYYYFFHFLAFEILDEKNLNTFNHISMILLL